MSENILKPASNKGGRPRKHGAYSFLRTGIIPKGKEPLAQMADAAISRMALDLGGLENLSGNQIVILREVRQLLIFKFLVDEKLAAEGFFKPGPGPLDLQTPLSTFYLSCSNSIARNCIALGLKKVSPAADLMAGYLKAKYSAVHDAAPAKAAAPAPAAQRQPDPLIKDTAGPEIVAPGVAGKE